MKNKTSILLATDSPLRSEAVQLMLKQEFGFIPASTSVETTAAQFEKSPPDILLLGLERLSVCRTHHQHVLQSSSNAKQMKHKTIVLCNNRDAYRAYRYCRAGFFDDYVPFWPMPLDTSRLNMSIHQAMRSPATDPTVSYSGKSSGSSRSDPVPAVHRLLTQNTSAVLSEDSSANAAPYPVVLVVDDDRLQREIICLMLRNANFQVIVAGSGEEALQTAKQIVPDVVLMDYVMPGMDGIETVKRMRKKLHLTGIPFIMMTGISKGTVVADSFNLGVADFVVKPFSRDTLIRKLRKALKRD